MNEIVNKFLLVRDKFIPEMHIKLPGFTYCACGSFNKNKERVQNFKETGDTKYIYKNELDKTCFQHAMAYGDFKYLPKRTVLDKVLRDKGFEIASNPNLMHIKEVLLLLFINFLIKSLQVAALKMKLYKISN